MIPPRASGFAKRLFSAFVVAPVSASAVVVIVVYISGFLFPRIALAQSLGTTIAPPFQEIELKPEQAKASFDLGVSNTTQSVQTFRLSVQDFGSLDESGGVAFLGTTGTALEHKYGLASWLSLGTDTLTIGPASTVKVAVTIENRPSLAPGGHYGAILLTSQGEPGAPPSPRVVVTQVLSTLVFVKKVGGEDYNLLLNQVDAKTSPWQLPSKIKLRFQNAGNIHVVPRGTIEVFDPRGKQVSKGIINQQSGIILPESYRVYPVNQIKTASSWLPGRYALKIKYRYDGQPNFTTQTKNFYYLGRAGLMAILVLFLILIVMVLLLVHLVRKQTYSGSTTP